MFFCLGQAQRGRAAATPESKWNSSADSIISTYSDVSSLGLKRLKSVLGRVNKLLGQNIGVDKSRLEEKKDDITAKIEEIKNAKKERVDNNINQLLGKTVNNMRINGLQSSIKSINTILNDQNITITDEQNTGLELKIIAMQQKLLRLKDKNKNNNGPKRQSSRLQGKQRKDYNENNDNGNNEQVCIIFFILFFCIIFCILLIFCF